MKRELLKGRNVFAEAEGLLAVGENELILWRVPSLGGNDEMVYGIDRIATTTAFKRGTVKVNDGLLVFKLGRIAVKAELIDGGESPPEVPEIPSALMDFPAECLKTTILASGKPNERELYATVQFEPSRIAATDGRRLHVCNVDTPAESPVLIRAEHIKTLLKLQPERYGVTSNGIYAEGNDWAYWAFPLEGKLPDYEQIVPRQFAAEARPNDEWRKDLNTLLKARAKDEDGVVIAGDGVARTSLGEIEDFAEIVNPDALGRGVMLNVRYLRDALEHTEGGRILFQGDTSAPVLIDGGERWAVLATMRW